MNKIEEHRLIELAQGISKPTAEEMHLLEHDAEVAREYDELRVLFSDLKEVPEPELDERAMRSILPSVKEAIRLKQEKSFLSGFLILPKPAMNFLTAVASIIVIIGMFIITGSVYDPFDSLIDSGFDFTLAGLDSSFYSIDTLHLEASLIDEINISGDLDDTLAQQSSDDFFEDATVSLIGNAAELDDDTFESLVKQISIREK